MRKIFVFGDSIVFGRKVNINSNWVSKLNYFFNNKFKDETITYNLGIPSETSKELVSRVKKEISLRIKQKNPDDFIIILIATGLNDAKIKNSKAQTTEIEFEENIKKIIEISKKYADMTVLVGPIRVSGKIASDFRNKLISKYNDIMQSICLSQKTVHIDLFGSWPLLKNNLYSDDEIHPSENGHEFIFKKVISGLHSFGSEFIDAHLVLKNELFLSKNEFQKFNLCQEIGNKIGSNLFLGNLQQKFASTEVILGGPCVRNDIEGITLNTFYQIFMPIKVASILNKPCRIYLGLKEEIISAPEKTKEFKELKKKLVAGINRISLDFGVTTEVIDTSELQIDNYVKQCKKEEGVQLSKEESEDLYSFCKNQIKTKRHTPTRILMNERVVTCHGSRFVNKATGFSNFLIVEDFEQIKAYLYLKNKRMKENNCYSDFLAFLPLPNIYSSTTMFKAKNEEKIFLSRSAKEYKDIWIRMTPSSKRIYNEILRLLDIPLSQFSSNINNFIDGMKRISNYFD